MIACVHVAKILPGKEEEFADQIRTNFEAGKEALREFGFRRIASFTSSEVSDDGSSLLITVYEADDPSVVERFYDMEPVIEQEQRAHGVLVAPHGHDAVPQNVAFLDLRLDG
jgi:hypothetical protein